MTYGMTTGNVTPAQDNLNSVFTPVNAVTGLVVMKRQ